jgi:hypothetical protein
MKIAVLGSGPLALEAALHFDQLGAGVTIFANNELGGMVRRINEFAPETSLETPWSSLSSLIGRESTKLSVSLEEIPSVGEYFQNYLIPLIEKGNSNIIIKPGKVERVHKRFLSIDEEVPGKSRLQDLFRVVFSTDPETNILKQVETNPELFEKLGEDVLNSLNESVESFDDFDLVIDATGISSDPNPMGPARSHALNESRLGSSSNVYYGRECFKNYKKVTKDSKHIVLVGSGSLSALLLCELDLWLEENKERMVTLVTTEGQPYKGLWELKACESLSLLTLDILKKYYSNLQEDRRIYEKSLFEWRDLEPHIKTKTPEPKIPTSQLNIVPASNVTALDRLLDREGLFVTLESNTFRNASEKSEEFINTMSCDSLFVCTGHTKNNKMFKGLRIDLDEHDNISKFENGSHREPGFYTLGSVTGRKSSLSLGLSQIEEIEKEIMNFFSRA